MGGATHGGANTLLRILDNHPRIFIPRLKTHRYFLQGGLTKGIMTSCRPDFATAAYGDQTQKSPFLFGEKQYNAALVAEQCPNAKIILSLRDPAERACRLFYWARAKKREPLRKFEDAVEVEMMGERTPENSPLCWLYKNQYEYHVKKWVSSFPAQNILLLIYEEWTNPDFNGLEPLERFLDLDIGSLVEEYNENFNAKEWINVLRDRKPPKYKPLSKRLRGKLEDVFAPDKAYISRLLNRDIPSWSV